MKDIEKVDVVRFLSNRLGIPERKIQINSSLTYDLGVAGDDGPELLQSYADEFGVVIGAYDIDTYFGREDSSSVLEIIFGIFRKKRVVVSVDITVLDLIKGVAEGRLFE